MSVESDIKEKTFDFAKEYKGIMGYLEELSKVSAQQQVSGKVPEEVRKKSLAAYYVEFETSVKQFKDQLSRDFSQQKKGEYSLTGITEKIENFQKTRLWDSMKEHVEIARLQPLCKEIIAIQEFIIDEDTKLEMILAKLDEYHSKLQKYEKLRKKTLQKIDPSDTDYLELQSTQQALQDWFIQNKGKDILANASHKAISTDPKNLSYYVHLYQCLAAEKPAEYLDDLVASYQKKFETLDAKVSTAVIREKSEIAVTVYKDLNLFMQTALTMTNKIVAEKKLKMLKNFDTHINQQIQHNNEQREAIFKQRVLHTTQTVKDLMGKDGVQTDGIVKMVSEIYDQSKTKPAAFLSKTVSPKPSYTLKESLKEAKSPEIRAGLVKEYLQSEGTNSKSMFRPKLAQALMLQLQVDSLTEVLGALQKLIKPQPLQPASPRSEAASSSSSSPSMRSSSSS